MDDCLQSVLAHELCVYIYIYLFIYLFMYLFIYLFEFIFIIFSIVGYRVLYGGDCINCSHQFWEPLLRNWHVRWMPFVSISCLFVHDKTEKP